MAIAAPAAKIGELIPDSLAHDLADLSARRPMTASLSSTGSWDLLEGNWIGVALDMAGLSGLASREV